jgi:hypothetical protein
MSTARRELEAGNLSVGSHARTDTKTMFVAVKESP